MNLYKFTSKMRTTGYGAECLLNVAIRSTGRAVMSFEVVLMYILFSALLLKLLTVEVAASVGFHLINIPLI